MKINLDALGSNLISFWSNLPEEDQLKGFSENLIAKRLSTEIEVLNILMPQYKFKKVRLFEETYWVHVRSYDKFRKSIEGLILR